MSLLDDFVSKMTPHITRLNANIAIQGSAIRGHLERIEQHASDLGRGDIGDIYFRRRFTQALTANERALVNRVPLNEIWLLQSMCANGQVLKSPAFMVDASRIPVIYIVKEGGGYEGIGGNAVFLPGDEIGITTQETVGENNLDVTFTFIRRIIPPQDKVQANLGPNAERVGGKPSHDPNRDEIAAEVGPWQESPPEIRDTEGSQDIVVDPTSV